MNRRFLLYGGAALVVLALLTARWGCRSGDNLPEGDSIEMRMAQIDEMRRRRHAGDVQRLTDLTQHEADSVSRAAVFALVDFESAKASETLQQMLQSNDNTLLRATAADALGQRGEQIPQLIEILNSQEDNAVRVGAARGLVSYSNSENREALPAFLRALRDEDVEIRRWAMRGITQISRKRFLFQPELPPQQQTERIAFIEQRMRELNLLD